MSDISAIDVRYHSHDALRLSDGAEIYYDFQGEGPAITFINNFYIVSPVWRNFTTDLARRTAMLTYDLRNQGASFSESSVDDFSTHVDDLVHLLDHVGVESTFMVGSSISTLIARDFALMYPDRVSGLIFVGPAFSPFGGYRRQAISKSWLASLNSGGNKQLFESLYPLVFSDQSINLGGPATYYALRETFLSLLSERSIRENLEASLKVHDDPTDLSGLSMPVEVLVGDGEFMWSDSMMDEMRRLIPHVETVTIPGAGHVPFFDNPNMFQDAILKFVFSQERK